uniref:Cell envelope biogenesis protein TonB n=1 Tax=uncultured bacterium Csd4 TaxID=1637487 RepID=A0A0F6WGA6_9BACT|nr:cell envelope biogenesis protein TonB [uncultured bacterium Csd4]
MMKSNLFSFTRMMALAIGMMCVTGVCAQNKKKVVSRKAPVRQSQKINPPEIKKEISEENQLRSLDELDRTPAVEGADDRNIVPSMDVPREEPMIEETPPPPPMGNKVFDVVEVPPQFPGGQSALISFLVQNVQYPPVAQKNGISGTVVVSFIVEKDGRVTDAKVVRGKDPSLDKEAVRVVRLMPNWEPGRINGEPVRTRYTLPLNFQLE